MFTVILFAVSLSLDAVAVGFSYGVKKIKIPILSGAVVGILSACFSALAIFTGQWISVLISPTIAKWIGLGMLFALSLWMLCQTIFGHEKETRETKEGAMQQERTILNLMLKSLGLSVTIIKHPVDCDFDGSKRIDFLESLYLGLMLSMDAICSCIGLALSGTVCWLTPFFIGIFQLLFLQCGNVLGQKLARLDFLRPKLIAMLPGIILLCVAVLRML